MKTITLNPYSSFSTYISDGFNEIITHVPQNVTVEELIFQIQQFILNKFYPNASDLIKNEVHSLIVFIVNEYLNNPQFYIDTYSVEQLKWIKSILYLNVGYNVSFDNILNYLEQLEDDITESGLEVTAQRPVMMALLAGKAVYQYWINELNAQQSKWNVFFTSPKNANYGNIGIWIRAAMEGALIGVKATSKGEIRVRGTDTLSTEIVSFIVGALVIGAGQVIFKWSQRILPVIYDDERMEGGFSEGQEIFYKRKKEKNSGDCKNVHCANPNCTNEKVCTDNQCYNNGCNICSAS